MVPLGERVNDTQVNKTNELGCLEQNEIRQRGGDGQAGDPVDKRVGRGIAKKVTCDQDRNKVLRQRAF